MDSQRMVILTRGGSDDSSVGQSLKRSGTVPNILEEPVDLSLLLSCPLAGNLQSCSVKQPYRQSNCFKTKQGGGPGEQPDVALTSQPALRETGDICGFNQPITVKTGPSGVCEPPVIITLDVPGLCDRPITDSASLSSTKDVPHLNSKWSLEPRTVSLETSSNGLTPAAVTVEGEIGDQSTEAMEHSEEPFHRMKAEDGTGNGESDGTEIRNGSPILLQMPLICHTAKAEGAGGKNGDDQRVTPPLQPPSRCHSGNGRPAEEGGAERAEARKGRGEKKQEEEGVALDLSLPKKRESKDRRLWHESSLLMEVDEVEGDGDRDIVEEDDGDEYDSILRIDGAEILGGPLLSPSFCSTSMFPFLSSLDSDCEGLLLIDDQGIPYTLTPEGHKVPQIDQLKRASPQTGQSLVPSSSVVVSSNIAAVGATQLSQSLVTPPTHNQISCPGPLTPTNPSQNEEHTKNPEPLTTTELSENVEPCKVVDSDVKAIGEARVMGSVLPHRPTHPLQNLPSSSLQLTTPLAKTDINPGLAFTLPLSLIQNSPGASTSMLLLLSTSTSSSSQSFSTSTPIALIDPSTGQLSQITASSLSSISLSSPLPLPTSPGQIVTSESSLPAILSQPVIRVPPDNPVAVLSRVTPSMNPATPLTSFSAASSTPKQPVAEETSNAVPVSSPLITRSSESDPDPQSLSTEEKLMVPTPNGSSPTNASLRTHPQSPSLTFDPSIEAVNQSSALESEHTSLPWNDHLYFSSTAPPSPPLVTVVSSSTPRNLETLDPLDLVSPASPPSTGPRRVLYCPLCPRIFYYLSDLERHSITHSQNKPHVCLQCGKAFKRSSHLQRHNHIHTGQRNFVCPICSKRFREAGELQRHQRVHTGEKPYQCSLCHTRFAERNTLRRHTKRKHPYHQAAVDMLTEGGDGRGGGEGEEETEEWYSSTVSNLENSDSEPDSEVIS